MAIRTLDLFCGGGGSSWGAQAAGAKIVCGVDAAPFAVNIYQRNFPKAKAVEAFLTEETGLKDFPALGKIDLLLASPECTNHTCARGSRPLDEMSKLTARYVLNFARELRPRFVVVENVISMRSWAGYKPLVDELEDLDYRVLPQVLDASELGVPQKRRRLFLLCERWSMPRPVPLQAGEPLTGRSVVDLSGRWTSKPVTAESHAPATLARIQRGIDALGRGVPFLVVYYGTDGSGGWHSLDKPIRTLTTLDRFGLLTWDGDQPMLRMLQVPELKAAMGFGPSYQIDEGPRRERIRVLGNGVCPPVMKAIVHTLTGTEVRHDALTAE
jgi:DNA (cytosine-5)-methyltransferase 1